MSLNAWPSHKMELYDGWILRFSYFYTHRTNSVEQFGNSTLTWREKIPYCESVYKRLGTPAVFKISVSGFAYLLLSMDASRTPPLVSPYNANVIPSKIVVFPAPVSPVTRKSPCPPSCVKSITVSSAYGPNADNVNFNGFIRAPPSDSGSVSPQTVPVLLS